MTADRAIWGRALTLKERLQLAGRGGEIDLARGEKRLRRWRAQAPFDDDALFARRLAIDGLSPERLVELLGETLAGGGPPPRWWVEVEASYRPVVEGGRARLPLPKSWERREGHEFWDFVEPLARRAHGELWGRIERRPDVAVDGPVPGGEDLGALLAACLPDELLSWPLRTLVLELHVASLQNELRGADSLARFVEFAARLRRPEVALALCKEYPVLARQLAECLERWRETTEEMLVRLRRDWPALAAGFGADQRDHLVGLRLGAGDRHRGGRSVALLRFASGLELVYKPRPLALDAGFQDLLSTLNLWGMAPGFRTLAMMDQGEYGWTEFVAATSCGSAEEVRRFYRRQGGTLAVLYLVCATDIHFENLVAAGEFPLVIDLESILQPGAANDDPLADDVLAESILEIGLLPVRNWENETSPGIDVSALGGLDGQLTPRPEPYWAEESTDRMHFARRSRQITMPGRHRPTLQGESVLAVDYAAEVVAGFEAAYALLEAHRDELDREGSVLRLLAVDESRVLVRPTAVYSLMLRESFHPDFLRDALDRDRFLDKLWVQVPGRPFLGRPIGAEQDALRRGDVPVFTTLASSRDLRSSDGQVFAETFSTAALARVNERLVGLGLRDRERQVWFIRASLAILSSVGAEHARGEHLASGAKSRTREGGGGGRVPEERLLELATATGDRLCDAALEEDGAVRWLGLQKTPQRTFKIGLLDDSLYSGQAGVALFLAYLGEASGEPRYTALARRSCRTLLADLDRGSEVIERLGAFEGVGGVIYVLCHLAALWSEEALLDTALRLTSGVAARIESDTQIDVVGGAAGCIAALAALDAQRPAAGLGELLVRCGEHIMASAVRAPEGWGWLTTGESAVPMTGFAHGASGIAAALTRLGARSGEERFCDAARAALRYERSLYSAEHGNWPDLRLETGRFAAVNWCQGAPGIGLARVLIGRYGIAPGLKEEVAAAVTTTVARGFGWNHCLCHGDLGNLDFLLLAEEQWPGLGLRTDIERLTAEVAAEIEERGGRGGLPMGVETPGLMVGLAGIGYGLLRLAARAKVPSVLALEPPRMAG